MTRVPWIKYLLSACLLLFEIAKIGLVRAEQEQFVPSIYSVDRTGSNDQKELNRERREAAGGETYVGDIEIAFSDPNMARELQTFLKDTSIYGLLPAVVVTGAKVASACSVNGSTADCFCEKGYKCVGTESSCDALGCKCTVNYPAEEYCKEEGNITMTPEKPFEGDTLKIVCQFSAGTTDISWVHNNSITISNSGAYTITFRTQGTMELSTLSIANVRQSNAGKYTCKGIYNRNPQEQYISVEVKSLSISKAEDIDVVCNGRTFILYCCSSDINLFSVTWTVSGKINIPGKEDFNSTCKIYTIQANIEQCPADQSGSQTDYTCTLKGIYGATSTNVIRVTYLREAIVTIDKINPVSMQASFDLICKSDVTNVDKVIWSKDTTTNVLPFAEKYIENGKAVSILHAENATKEWSGTYFCTFYQKTISSTANVRVKVVSLPPKQSIRVEPTATYQKCNTALPLKCCFGDDISEILNVYFESGAKRIAEGSFNDEEKCYSASYTDTDNCPGRVIIYCNIFNTLGKNISSNDMEINYWKATETKKICIMDAVNQLPESPYDAIVSIPCKNRYPTQLGDIDYKCNNGKWEETPKCYSAVVFNQLLEVESLVNGPQPEKDLPIFLQGLSDVAANESKSISDSSANIRLMVSILTTVSDNSQKVDTGMMTDFIKTVDIVVDNTDSWKGVKEKSSKLLLSVEKFAENLVNGSDFKANNNTSNVQLKVTTLNTTSNYNEGFKFTNLTGEVKIRNNSIAGEAKTVVSIAYSTMKDILPSNTTKTVNGLVISTVVVGRNKSDDVSISLTFSKINSSLDNPDCVFWDFNKSQSGDWNNEGCTASETGGFVICTCNHLTSFSMLMGEPKSRNLFLDIITYAGVGISIGCLFIALAIEAVVWKSVIKNKTSYMRHVCLVNISVSLLAADIWFIIGAALEKYPDSDSCLTAAFFSFFFYLSLFFWMLSTGLILFYRLVFILHDISRKTMMIVAFTMGYGCPVVISVITVASTAPTKGFTSRKFCWLDYNTTKTFLAFVVPALTIVFVNCIILLVVICKLVRPTVGEKTGKEERTVLVQISKSLAVLTPLLGITWGFGLGVVATPDSTALHGIFAALNSFQGLFILLSTVLLDQKVRTIVRSTISRSYLSTLRSKATTTTSSTNSTSDPQPAKRKRTSLFKRNHGLYNIYTVHSSSNETSNEYYSVLT